jgi:predicted ATPase/class 3 adenylate cyclase
MFCSACGTEFPVRSGACPNCGAQLPHPCAHCQVDLPSGAKFCPSCGQPVDASNAGSAVSNSLADPAGERKQVTVLFADFCGFTTFAHKRDAEEVRDFVTSAWATLDNIIAAHGGTTEKHIGDAIMAVFGSKQVREEDPAQAVRAALAMQAGLAQTREASTTALQLRIGVHTGLAVVGPVGPSGEITVTGDTVNLASRLQSSAPVGGVLVSNDTWRHIQGLFDVQRLPPFEVKGRPEAVQAYIILRAKPRALAMQLRGLEGVRAEMVGRREEMELLQAAFQRGLTRQDSEIITLVGEAGIGKSFLLSQFQEWVELLPETVRFFYGRAGSQTTGQPFSLIRDVFANRFEIQDSDPSAVARQKLERGIVELLAATAEPGSTAGAVPAAVAGSDDTASYNHVLHAHFIGQLLGLDFRSSPWLRESVNDPHAIRYRAFQSFVHFFRAATRKASTGLADSPIKGALLVVEDIHWSDDGSLDLLAYLASACRQVPLLIVCVARPTLLERRSRWGDALSNHKRLDLEPLRRDESLALVESLLRRAPNIPQALRELIVGGAEGIPFYIEEIIKMLIDQKVILPGPEDWRIEPQGLAAARVPPTLMGVLQARLDSLQPLERLVLQRAAVIGRTFWDTAIERLSQSTGLSSSVLSSDPDRIGTGIADGAEPGSPFPDFSPAIPIGSGHASERGKFRAQHSTTPALRHPEILAALDNLRRKELIFRRDSSDFAGSVEYTFKHELLRNVAYESLLKKSRRTYHGQSAAWLIEQSGERINEVAALVAGHFEQAGQTANAAEWFGRAGHQARAGYAPANAIDHFQKALALLPASGDRDAQARQADWLGGLVEVLGAQARFKDALEVCNQFCSLAEQLEDAVLKACALNGQAFLNERLGQYRASIDAAQQAEAIAGAAGESARAESVRALLLKGWAFYRLSDAAAVLAIGEEARALCLALDDSSGLATSFKLLGVAHLQLGQLEEADHFFQEGLNLYERLTDRRNSAAMLSNLGESARARGDYERAERLYVDALAAVRQIGHRESEAIYLGNLSAARLGLGKYADAEKDVQKALALVVDGNFCALAETFACLSEACLGQGKMTEALDAAQRALDLARQSGSDLDLGTAWRALGLVLASCDNLAGRASSRAESAADCFLESHRVFKKISAGSEAARTLRDWANFDFKNGRATEGQERLAQAKSILGRLSGMPR